MQLVHIVLLFMTLSMVLDMIKTYSKAVHRYVEVHQKNIRNFVPIFSIFLMFNIVIGSSFGWNVQTVKDLAKDQLSPEDTDVLEYVGKNDQINWDDIGDFQKTVRVIIGGLMYEIIHNTHDQESVKEAGLIIAEYWIVILLMILVQIYALVFILSLFFTVVQVTLTPRDLSQDIYDYEFLAKKNL